MPRNNIRICSYNMADFTVLSMNNADSSYPITNAQKDSKSLIVRANQSSVSVTCDITLKANTLYCFLLAGTNVTDGTLMINSVTQATYISSDTSDYIKNGKYTYSYGANRYALAYYKTPAYDIDVHVVIQVSTSIDTNVEFGRLVIGPCWIPKFNFADGFSVDQVDSSKSNRGTSGNMLTLVNPTHKVMNFSLPYLTADDKNSYINIMLTRGPIFVSLFPTESNEMDYVIYGRLVTLNSINHPVFTQYSTNIQIEEL